MRSKEVADFAGVTVRTLRHYHQLGILPEPPRLANSYREYGAVDVARVLRIKRLASLGFSLEQVGDMLSREPGGIEAAKGRRTAKGRGASCTDASARESFNSPDIGTHGESACGAYAGCGQSAPSGSIREDCHERSRAIDAYAALDQLDAELAAQIELLREKRQIIARLKQELSGTSPVLEASPDIVAHMALLQKHGASSVLSTLELEQILLVSEYEDGEKVIDGILRLNEFIEHAGGMGEYVSLSNEMMALPADASKEVREDLARRAVEFFAPMLQGYLEQYGTIDESDGLDQLEQIIDSYEDEIYNDAQKQVTAAILDMLSDEFGFDVGRAAQARNGGASPHRP